MKTISIKKGDTIRVKGLEFPVTIIKYSSNKNIEISNNNGTKCVISKEEVESVIVVDNITNVVEEAFKALLPKKEETKIVDGWAKPIAGGRSWDVGHDGCKILLAELTLNGKVVSPLRKKPKIGTIFGCECGCQVRVVEANGLWD